MKSSKDAIRTARQLLKLTMVDGKLDAAKVKATIAKVKESQPRGYLGILDAYVKLVRLELAKRHAVIESAVELESSTKASVTADLKAKYGDDLTFEYKINKDLIGGMRVKVGSDVWDGSVKARLTKLAEAFG